MKYILATICVILGTSAVAAKTVPLPPKRPPAPIFTNDLGVYGAYVKDGQVFVRAPLDSDTQIDVDNGNVNISVDKGGGFSKVLPWNWTWFK